MVQGATRRPVFPTFRQSVNFSVSAVGSWEGEGILPKSQRRLYRIGEFSEGRLAQRKSIGFTHRGSQVQILYRPPIKSIVYEEHEIVRTADFGCDLGCRCRRIVMEKAVVE